MIRPLVALGGALGLLCVPAAAVAAPDCATPLPPLQTVIAGQGSLEAVAVAPDGRLYYSASDQNAILRLARPGAQPEVVASGIEAPGGLAFDADPRYLFAGEGDSVANGASAPLAPNARLLRIDTVTGEKQVYAAPLGMANGVVRAADGTLFASNDITGGIDRIAPDGTVQRVWSPVSSANGMAIDKAQKQLFVAQTFQPASIAVVDLVTGAQRTFTTPGPEDIAAGLDGMDIAPDDALAVAANLPGEVWRVGTDGAICVLGRGLGNASAVAYGRGPAGTFEAGRLYGVGFSGVVVEVPGARFDAPPVAAPAPAPAADPAVDQRRARAVALRRARAQAARARERSRRSVARRRAVARRATLVGSRR